MTIEYEDFAEGYAAGISKEFIIGRFDDCSVNFTVRFVKVKYYYQPKIRVPKWISKFLPVVTEWVDCKVIK